MNLALQLYGLRLYMLTVWMLLGVVIAMAWHGVSWYAPVVIGIGLDIVTWRHAEWFGDDTPTGKRIMP